jgi:hypothetical protein
MMKDYIVVSGHSTDDLVTLVNARMKNGWVTLGGPFADPPTDGFKHRFYQAMAKVLVPSTMHVTSKP